MRRKLLIFAVGVCGVLCVAAAVLWVRSYWVWEGVYVSWSGDGASGTWVHWEADVQSVQGTVRFNCEQVSVFDAGQIEKYRAFGGVRSQYASNPPPAMRLNWWAWHRPRISYGPGPMVPGQTRWGAGVRVPYWLAVPLLMVLPAWWCRRALRARAARRVGLCPTCGYDLRATPDRCPECGAVPRPVA